MSKSIKSVAIIGAGLMGRQIAGELISCGVNVLLLELSPPKGPRDAWLKKSMKAMKKDQPSPYLSESDLSDAADHYPPISSDDFSETIQREQVQILPCPAPKVLSCFFSLATTVRMLYLYSIVWNTTGNGGETAVLH